MSGSGSLGAPPAAPSSSSSSSSCAGGAAAGDGSNAEDAAKDHADIAAFFRAGFRKNDEMKAMEVLPILKEKVAYLSGINH